jgi:hypothetical protein
MTWRTLLTTLPTPGTMVDVDGQRFECLRHDVLRKAGGSTVPVAVWRSACVECGATYFTRTGISSNGPTRRCRKHRRGGAHVARGPSRPLNVTVVATPSPVSNSEQT